MTKLLGGLAHAAAAGATSLSRCCQRRWPTQSWLASLGALHHFARPFSAAYVELAASLTLMVGVLAFLFAAARLGFLVRAIPLL